MRTVLLALLIAVTVLLVNDGMWFLGFLVCLGGCIGLIVDYADGERP